MLAIKHAHLRARLRRWLDVNVAIGVGVLSAVAIEPLAEGHGFSLVQGAWTGAAIYTLAITIYISAAAEA